MRRGTLLFSGLGVLALSLLAWLLARPAPAIPGGSPAQPSEDGRRSTTLATSGVHDNSGQTASPSNVRLSPLDPRLRGVGGLRMRLVQGDTSDSVPGAQVVLHGTGHGGEPIRVVATSDAEGRVAMPDVPAGPWLTLQVALERRTVLVRADVDVVAGRDADLGDVPVDAPRALVVTVWDEGARPVRGAAISAFRISREEYDALSITDFWDGEVVPTLEIDPVLVGSALADREGRATLEPLTSGAYLVTAEAPGLTPLHALVRVPREADLRLPPWILRPATMLRGRVVDESGAAVAGARVSVGPFGSISYGTSVERWTHSDSRGTFALKVPAGRTEYEVRARARGRLPGGASGDGLAPLVVTLPRGADVEVRVVDAETGEPLRGARVCLWMDDERPEFFVGWCTATVDSDGEGLARMTVPPGRPTRMEVSLRTHATAASTPADEGETALPPLPDRLEAGTTLRVMARLSRQPTAEIRGCVVGLDGHPVPGVAIVEEPEHGGSSDIVAFADADGAFRFSILEDDPNADGFSLPHERCRDVLRVAEPGLATDQAGYVRLWNGEPSRETLVRTTLTMTIRGRALDESGAAVSGAFVHWARGRPEIPWRTEEASIVTGRDGTFALHDLNPSRSGTSEESHVVVRARGFMTARSEPLVARPGRTVDVGPLVLERGFCVEGLVLDPMGHPAAGTRLVLGGAFALADPAGRFWIGGLDAGKTHHLVAYPRRLDEAVVAVDLHARPAGTASDTVRLAAATSLEGSVFDAEGSPIASACIRCAPPGSQPGSRSPYVLTDDEGRFRVDHVPIGPTTLFVGDRRWEPRLDLEVPLRDPLVWRLPSGADSYFGPSLIRSGWPLPDPPDDSAW